MFRSRFLSFVVLAGCALPCMYARQFLAQDATSPDAPSADASNADAAPVDPLHRKLSDKERLRQQKALRQELKGPYKKWLDEDVRWIISDDERKAFLSLSNDEERDNFIEQFWRRRNPDPESPANSFREEHYRRIAYANEHFYGGEEGWRTDRGHIYIVYGPPDSIDSHPSGGLYHRSMDEGGGQTDTFPFEVWHYKHIDGIGDNVEIEFVDTCMCSEYHMTLDRGEKDALAHIPGAGPTLLESRGVSQAQRYGSGSIETLGPGPAYFNNQDKEFDRMVQFSKLLGSPPVKFKDMEEFMTSHKVLTGPFFPFDVRTDFVRITDDTILVPITLQVNNRDITFNTKNGVSSGTVNILGRVSTITGRIVQTFEDTVQVSDPSELLAQAMKGKSVYWKALPLRPGRYRLDIVIKDVNNPDHVGTYARALDVPHYDDDHLAASSLILADKMEPVATRQIGTGNFVIGNTYIRPRVSSSITKPASFQRNQSLNFWMQVYNLGINTKTRHNDATLDYQITRLDTNQLLLNTSEPTSKINPNSDQVTVEKSLPLSSLQPGKYSVTVKVTDAVTQQQLQQSASFEVE